MFAKQLKSFLMRQDVFEVTQVEQRDYVFGREVQQKLPKWNASILRP
jgi:hypothetical protein